MSIAVTLTPGSLPAGYCFTSLQQYFNDIINNTSATLPGTLTLFNFGPNIPDPADQDKPWIRTNVDGSFDRLYTFFGVWLSPHPTPYGGNERRLWVGTEAQLWAYDGGDGTDPATATDTTGSMWDIDGNFDLRFPYGADARTGSAGTVAPAATGGAASATGLAAHTHSFPVYDDGGAIPDMVAGTVAIPMSQTRGDRTVHTLATSSAGSGAGTIDTIPPYEGVYFIKRSARKYYTVI